MIDKNNALEYNYKILAQERKKRKISQDQAAVKLTLSVGQIKSLENNLEYGFITPHFRNLALKRYAKFLEIPFYKIIPIPATQEKIVDYPSKEVVSQIDKQNKNLLQLLILKIRYFIMGLVVLSLLVFFFFIPANKAKIPSSEIVIPEIAVIDYIDVIPVNKNFIQNKNLKADPKESVQEAENKSDTISTEFLCSIESASMDKIWSRINPEKPPTYFHIVSLKKQSICTIDNRGVLRKYNLDDGEKLTHRGEAPFKVQLNPSISELYFQGWKVYLEKNDNFVQLNPVDMAIELN
tara:strand:+ start:99 stop:980 length:882 start_codon:yes stop_codon:yes gene_type:complete